MAYANQGDAVIFARIHDVAKSHHKIQHFVEATGFRSRKTHGGKLLFYYAMKPIYEKLPFSRDSHIQLQ